MVVLGYFGVLIILTLETPTFDRFHPVLDTDEPVPLSNAARGPSDSMGREGSTVESFARCSN